MNFTFALRLVIGWTYFSAFWRRLVLDNKLDPEVAGYIGEKFNHFLPHALFIKAPIEYLLTQPEILWWVMVVFTIVEGITGLLLMLGVLTRIMSLITMGLAMGILLSAGWIGTTCLDEWQIGILGMAGGLTIFFSGGGKLSLDEYFNTKRWDFPFLEKFLTGKLFVTSSIFVFLLALFTNQVFHGGVWGTLHNKSIRPKLELSNYSSEQGLISFDLMRTEGADVYGSFVYRLEVIGKESNEILFSIQGDEWSRQQINITNKYIAKIRPHEYSLLVPLGAKAQISFQMTPLFEESYVVRLIDINGSSWSINH